MEKDWKFYYNEGVQYLQTANGWHAKGKKFNNELKFNMLSISMERMLVGLLLFNKEMPYSETVTGLVREAKPFVNWSEKFIKEVKKLNKYMFLCSLDPDSSKAPNDSELEEVYALAAQLKDKINTELEIELV